MKIIVAYDIVDNRRRARMHRFLRELGINTQKSVFECEVSAAELDALRRYAAHKLNHKEDRLGLYHLCRHCASHAEVQGLGIQLVQLDYQLF